MDDAQVDQGSWLPLLARFKNLVRPDGSDSSGDVDEGVEAARGTDSAKSALGVMCAALPDLIFEGQQDWYGYPDLWVLAHLGRVLSQDEEREILSRLAAGTPQALGELLDYVVGQLRGVWRQAGGRAVAPTVDGSAAQTLTGASNSANWQVNQLPGTYYYTLAEGEYLYCDLPRAPAGQWAPLPVREQQAAEKALPWHDSGWFYTLVSAPELYGGPYVYAADRGGPWMALDQATAQLGGSTVGKDDQRQATVRYTDIVRVPGYPEWAQGFDNQEHVWKYARMKGNQLPGQGAPWTAPGALRANNTERFVGPGYSDTGWVPYAAAQSGKSGARGPGNEGPLPPYKTEKPTTGDEVTEIEMDAALAYFKGKGWSNAEKLLGHYMEGKGAEYSINPETLMLEVPGFAQAVHKYLADQKVKQPFDSGWTNTNTDNKDVFGNVTDQQSYDWYWGLHDWRYRIQGTAEAGGKSVIYHYTLEVFKPYIFGSPRKDIPIPGTSHLPGGSVRIHQDDIEHLNKVGKARNFNVSGKATITYAVPEKAAQTPHE